MSPSIEMPGAQPDEPPGYLVMEENGAERVVPVFDQLFIGRECAGISEERRLVIHDPEISRTHLEIRLDTVANQAFVIDTSTNGTVVNGIRLERAVPQPIVPGDTIQVGDVAMIFRSRRFTSAAARVSYTVTRTRISQAAMVMVVGDIINYSTISQVTDEGVVAQSLRTLWREVGSVLQTHKGTLNHFAGDAIFAIWETTRFPDAAARAIDFALAANRLVDELGPTLPMHGPDGAPVRMGWGVVQGKVALAAMTRSAEAVIGDSTNVAFRLAGLAGREGRNAVIATSAVRRQAEAEFRWGEGEDVELKGRRGTETVYPVLGRQHPDARPVADAEGNSYPTAGLPVRESD